MGRGATCGYHCTAKALSFGKGQSAVHTAAYNAREKLYQEQQERWSRDYSREGEVLFKGIFAPNGAPEWTQDRQALWNRAEAAERQKVNGQPARNMIVGLPHELNQQQREWLLKDFAREAFARKGMIADVAMHAPDAKGDERNYHAHILLTMRKLDGDEFAKTKCREWNRKEQLGEWREQWASMGAKALHRAGYPVEAERWRHGHQTYAEQRAAALERGDKEFAESLGNREPTFHKGVKSTALERSGGSNERLARLEGVIARNDIKLEMKQLDGELARLEGLEAATNVLAGREAARQKVTPDMPAPKARGVKSDGLRRGGRTHRTARDKVLAGSEGMAGEHEGTDAEDDEARREGLGLGGREQRDGRGDEFGGFCVGLADGIVGEAGAGEKGRYGSLCFRSGGAEGAAVGAGGGGAGREQFRKGD